MRNEDAFVRYHYIQFAQKLVPFMENIVESSQLAIHVQKFIKTFCELLDQADVSDYQNTNDQLQTVAQEDKEDLELDNTVVSKPQIAKRLTINQENDIVSIIQGFSQIINYSLKV